MLGAVLRGCRSSSLATNTGTRFDRHLDFDARIKGRAGSKRGADECLATRRDRVVEVLADGDERAASVERRFATNADVLNELGQVCFEGSDESHEVRRSATDDFDLHGGRCADRFCLNLRATARFAVGIEHAFGRREFAFAARCREFDGTRASA